MIVRYLECTFMFPCGLSSVSSFPFFFFYALRVTLCFCGISAAVSSFPSYETRLLLTNTFLRPPALFDVEMP